MPVLLLTSSDGRLSAIAMNGLQNMVPTDREVKVSTEKTYQDFRAWMVLVASLMATAAFTAGLTPPGGFWAEDKDADEGKNNGHVAGTSVMRDKYPRRYAVFQLSNAFTFFYSLMAIGVLAKSVLDNKRNTATTFERRFDHIFAVQGVIGSLLMFGISYISGTWEWDRPHKQLLGNPGKFNIGLFVLALVGISIQWINAWISSRRSSEQTPDTNNS